MHSRGLFTFFRCSLHPRVFHHSLHSRFCFLSTSTSHRFAMAEGDRSIVGDISLLDRYKGCLTAALIGDCVGVIFERPGKYMKSVDPQKIDDAIQKQLSDPSNAPLPYSDDSAMAHALIDSLLRCEEFNPTDVAIEFNNKFTREVNKQKMYAKVKLVFKAWQKTNFKGDIFLPAKKQFEGGGSLGNGGGMRIVGVPLFYGRDLDAMIKTAKQSTQLTHAHPIGYNGAILQAYAIHLALFSGFSAAEFVNELLSFCKTKLEVVAEEKTYTNKMLTVQRFLQSQQEIPGDEVVAELGHSVMAHESIPTAIYCALRATQPISNIQKDCPLQRAIIYAISLGGDTDTIATMAGAISGAMFGIGSVPEDWQKMCEASEKTTKRAEALYARQDLK